MNGDCHFRHERRFETRRAERPGDGAVFIQCSLESRSPFEASVSVLRIAAEDVRRSVQGESVQLEQAVGHSDETDDESLFGVGLCRVVRRNGW